MKMEVILVDLVDSNRVEGCNNDATDHSLSSLVSSDDSTADSLEQWKDISPTKDHPSVKNCVDSRHRHVARISGTEISIIACSSPEIKALVQSVPPSIQCLHQRSVSTLSFYPEYDNIDELCGNSIAPVTKMNRNGCPVVSPDHEHTMKLNDHKRLSIEHRDQKSFHSEGRFIFDDQLSPVSRNLLYNEAVDELTLRLEQQRIEPNRMRLPEFQNKDVRDASHPNNTTTYPQEQPIKKRNSMHRRVSYDNLPDISEILCHPDFLSTNTT